MSINFFSGLSKTEESAIIYLNTADIAPTTKTYPNCNSEMTLRHRNTDIVEESGIVVVHVKKSALL